MKLWIQKILLFSILFSLFAILHSPVFAQTPHTYYVATDGSDGNPGTLSQPFKTIQKGADIAQAGETVYIRGGTYTDGLIVIKNSGHEGAFITFTNYNNEKVIIDDTWLNSNIRNWDSTINQPAAMIHIVGKSYIKISGLNLINQPPTVYCNNPPQYPSSNCIDGDANKGFSVRYGIRIISKFTSVAREQNDDWVNSIDSPADHIIIENNHIEETKSAAIAAWTGATNITIDGNTVVNGQNDHANGVTGSDQEVIDVCEASDFEIKNNHVSYNGRPDNHSTPENPTHFWGVPGGILVAVKGGRHLNMSVKNGQIHHNTITGDPHEGGIYIDGEKTGLFPAFNSTETTAISNIDIYDNYFFNSHGVSMASECGGIIHDIRVFNNVINYSSQSAIGISTTNTCYDSFFVGLHPPPPGNGLKKNISIFNNTIFGTFTDGGRGIWITTSAIENIQIKNNIVAFVPVSQNDIIKAYHTPTGYPPYYGLYTAQITRLAKDPMGYPIPANQIFAINNLIVDKTIYPLISNLSLCDTCGEVALPGSIVANPLFIKSTIGVKTKDELPLDYMENFSDFHLNPASPAINTAINAIDNTLNPPVMAPLTDFDSLNRPQGSGYDIGAYEFASSTSPTPTQPPPTPTSAVIKSGDANNDGKVDGQDYVKWLTYYGSSSTGPTFGDFDNNSYVDGKDYVIWLNYYGK
jgi:hypothetical protein